MKTLLNATILILSLFAPNSKAFVLASRCPLYSLPNFASAIVQFQDEDYYLTQNQEVEVLSQDGDFILIKTSDDVEGYVYKYYLTQNSSLTTYPVFNCSVRANSLIYDLSGVSTTFVAKKDSRVFIYNGFDNVEGGFTEVQVVLEDGSLYNGLLKSSDLKPDGVNRSVIIAIPVIMAGVTVILTILLLGRKKRKKKKSKKNGSTN